MLLRPVVSEKAIGLADTANKYVFYVPLTANKTALAREVARRFEVSVIDVKTAIIKGKPKRVPVQRGKKLIPGSRSVMKKAFVTVKDGDSISLFEGSE